MNPNLWWWNRFDGCHTHTHTRFLYADTPSLHWLRSSSQDVVVVVVVDCFRRRSTGRAGWTRPGAGCQLAPGASASRRRRSHRRARRRSNYEPASDGLPPRAEALMTPSLMTSIFFTARRTLNCILTVAGRGFGTMNEKKIRCFASKAGVPDLFLGRYPNLPIPTFFGSLPPTCHSKANQWPCDNIFPESTSFFSFKRQLFFVYNESVTLNRPGGNGPPVWETPLRN